MGDFNVALNLEDSISGSSRLNAAMYDFKACVNNIEVMDINSSGLHYTWNQKPKGRGGILKKLDRIIGNIDFVDSYPAETFVSHYQKFLGTNMTSEALNIEGLFIKRIFDGLRAQMVRNVTNEEIKSAMFSIGDDRAPGPDGFTSAFFKKSWNIVGDDICKAVRDFFSNGKLLKETNHTFLALIPKVFTSFRVTDYRPISCCSVLCKCISKILTNRIIDGIKEMASDSQSAFISGRRILDNILITQELMHNYHRDRGPPRCVFKVDIQKAYDSVDWGFLRNILHCFSFHTTMVKWIMACVSLVSFSLSINGDKHGYFQGRIYGKIVNVCFADDLFIFSRGEVDSARLIMESLEEFQKSLRLVPSIPKSTVYYCNVHNHVKVAILNIMSFAEGELLVKLVLSSMQVFWVSVLVIPKGVILDIQQQIKGFLWCNDELKRCKAKMAWDILCLPKHEVRLAKSIIGHLLIAAASYFIWVERNNRIFKNTRRSPEEIRDSIMVTVRLKLLTFRFKNTTMVNELLTCWKTPKNFRLYV
nr:hypothetical protein [Tanacetum cinerariifolium]